MQKLLSLISVISHLFFSNSILSQNKIKALPINISEIPKEIKYAGTYKAAVKWTETSGDHIAIISESEELKKNNTEADMEEKSKQLFGVCYSIKKDSTIQKWKVFDQITNCPFDLTASFIQNTFQVTDLNNNGIAEVWIMYKLVCRSDVSPCDMKIIMYEGQKKFAMRGQNKVKMNETEYAGGNYKFDKTFNEGPKAFRDHAIKIWDKNSIENWEN